MGMNEKRSTEEEKGKGKEKCIHSSHDVHGNLQGELCSAAVLGTSSVHRAERIEMWQVLP